MDWLAEKSMVMAEAKCVVVKVGSAVLTNQHGLDLEVIKDLVLQLSFLHRRGLRVVLVSSGAVAAGRAVLRADGKITGLPGKQAASAIGQSRLMHTYDQFFGEQGIISAQVLLTRDDLGDRHRFLNARNTFSQLLSWSVLPIINENDTVAVQELKFGDNDTLASLILNLVEADLFVNLTTVGGVLAQNPEKVEGAEIMPCIEDVHNLDLDELCGGKTDVGSGGMYSKLLAARRASQLGVPTLILPGREKQVLVKAFSEEDVRCTWVRANVRGVSRRKFWMAYNQNVAGAIVVDDGAAKALRGRGSSLLPAGVLKVDGLFEAGDLVRIITESNDVVGVGLSNYSSSDLSEIMGRRLSELEAAKQYYLEAIHRDNLLVGAVL